MEHPKNWKTGEEMADQMAVFTMVSCRHLSFQKATKQGWMLTRECDLLLEVCLCPCFLFYNDIYIYIYIYIYICVYVYVYV